MGAEQLLGEGVRFFKSRHTDFTLWFALLAGLAPLPLYFPLIKAASSYSQAFWSKAHWSSAIVFYDTMLMPGAGTFLLLILSVFLLSSLLSSIAIIRAPISPASPAFRGHEIAAVFGLTLVPVVVVILCKLSTGTFNVRYVLYTVIGLARVLEI